MGISGGAEKSTVYREITEKERVTGCGDWLRPARPVMHGGVAPHYEIQEILAQDANGVVFHAIDRSTRRNVVLRRFFPFGAAGGGLARDERDAYAAAVENLKTLVDPGLRTVLDGGCDPVDGIPFLVTEWVEGERLSQRLSQKPLSLESTRALLGHAIEASLRLSGLLGKEGVWVETHPQAVILSEGEGGRGVTFWICPFRWLGDASAAQGLLPLVELAEEALHWRGRIVPESAGEGFGSWVNSIKENPWCWTLRDAQTALDSLPAARVAAGENAGSTGVPTVAMRTPSSRVAERSRRTVSVVAAIVIFIAAVGALFAAFKARGSTENEVVADAPGARSEVAGARSFEGRVVAVETSGSGKSRYLVIETGGERRFAGIRTKEASVAPSQKEMHSFVNRRIRVTGRPAHEIGRGEVIIFDSRGAVELLD